MDMGYLRYPLSPKVQLFGLIFKINKLYLLKDTNNKDVILHTLKINLNRF
jgi:hypothetical protein